MLQDLTQLKGLLISPEDLEEQIEVTGDSRFKAGASSPADFLSDAEFDVIRKVHPTQEIYLVFNVEHKRVQLAELYFYNGVKAFEVRDLTSLFPQLLRERLPQLAMRAVHLRRNTNEGAVLCLYDLGEATLKQDLENKCVQAKSTTEIALSLTEQLYSYHLSSIAIMQLQPDFIVRDRQGYFLLPTFESMRLAKTDRLTQTTAIVRGLSYLSPALYAAYQSKEPLCTHNVFLSDVYALGIVLLEQQLRKKLSKAEVENLLMDRPAGYSEAKKQFKLQFRESLYTKADKLFFLNDPIQMMLRDKEEDRSSAFELWLYFRGSGFLLEHLKIPFEEFFTKHVKQEGEVYTVTYRHSPLVFIGTLDEPPARVGDLKERVVITGSGSLFLSGTKVFEGEFSNNEPVRGNLYINEQYTYAGEVKDFSLIGQGQISRGEDVIAKGQWHFGVLSDRPFNRSTLSKGIYSLKLGPSESLKFFHRKELGQTLVNISLVEDHNFVHSFIANFNFDRPRELSLRTGRLNNLFNNGHYDQLHLVDDEMDVTFVIPPDMGLAILNLMLSSTVSWAQLARFDSSGVKLTDNIFKKVIAKNPALKQLVLCDSLVTDQSLRLLFRCKSVARLEVLDLSGCNISEEGLKRILLSPIRCLKELRINNCPRISSVHLARLLIDKKLWDLEVLALDGMQLNREVFKELPSLPIHLKTLSINKVKRFDEHVLMELLRVFDLNGIANLSMDNVTIRSKMVNLLSEQPDSLRKAKSSRLKKLSLLRLSTKNNLGLASFFMRSLGNPSFKELARLDLSNTPVDNEGVEGIELSLFRLQELKLRSCFNITNRCAPSICQMKNLVVLDLTKTFLTSKALEVFAEQKKPFRELFLMQVLFTDLVFLSYAISSLKVLHIVSSQLSDGNGIELLGTFSLDHFQIWCSDELANGLWQFSQSFRRVVVHGGRGEGKGWGNCEEVVGIFGVGDSCPLEKPKELPSSLIELSQSRLFEKISQLDFSNQYNVPEDEFSYIFNSRFATKLQVINISWSALGDRMLSHLCEGAVTAAQHPKFRLKVLKMAGQIHVTDGVVCQLVHSGVLDSLEILDLGWTSLTSAVLVAIAQSNMRSLKKLTLCKNSNVNDKGVVALANSKAAASLTRLDLRFCNITNFSLDALAGSEQLHNLRVLLLRNCRNVSLSGIRTLVLSDLLRLEQLDISWTKVGYDLLDSLKDTKFPLTRLSLAGIKLRTRNFVKFLSSEVVPRLELLDLSFTGLEEIALHPLLGLKLKLCSLLTQNLQLSPQFVAQLREKFKPLQVIAVQRSQLTLRTSVAQSLPGKLAGKTASGTRCQGQLRSSKLMA